MNLSVEQQLVLCCAKINWAVDGTTKLQELLRRPIHWEKVMQLAGDAGISPLVYHALNNAVDCSPNGGCRWAIPQPVMQKLHQAHQSNAIRNLMLYQELKKIIQAAGEKGIPVIVLKGAALATSVYPNIALRPMGDIDLLVHQEHLELMDTIMRQFGYENNIDDTWIEKRSHHVKHLPRYIRHAYGVDIHWNLVNPDGPVTLDLCGIWDRARRMQIDDFVLISYLKGEIKTQIVPALMLAPEDLILHLCLHASAQHLFRIPLKSLCDIAEAIHYYHEDINWQKMLKIASDAQMGVYIALTLTLAKRMLDMPLKENILLEFYPTPVDNGWIEYIATEILTNHKTSVQAPWNLAFTQKTLLAKLKAALRCILPSRQRLSDRFNVPASSPLIYPYYLIYIFDWIKRRGFKATLALMESKQRRLKIEPWLESMRGEE